VPAPQVFAVRLREPRLVCQLMSTLLGDAEVGGDVDQSPLLAARHGDGLYRNQIGRGKDTLEARPRLWVGGLAFNALWKPWEPMGTLGAVSDAPRRCPPKVKTEGFALTFMTTCLCTP
jgi:hypothetical protein